MSLKNKTLPILCFELLTNLPTFPSLNLPLPLITFNYRKQFERKSENASVEMQMSAKKLNEAIIVELAPLLEKTSPTLEICLFLSKVSFTFNID